jgi:hypothetical protein
MKKISWLLTVTALALTGCGSDSDDEYNPTINDAFVQKNAKLSQQKYFVALDPCRYQNGNGCVPDDSLTIEDSDTFWRYDFSNGASYVSAQYRHEDTERCSAYTPLCMQKYGENGLIDSDWESHRDALDLSYEELRTVRYRTASEVNDPEVELLPVYINLSSEYTQARQNAIVKALEQIEADAGQRIFQFDESGKIKIRHADFSRYTFASETRGIAYNLWDGYEPPLGLPNTGPTARDTYEKLIAEDGVAGGLVISFGTNFDSSVIEAGKCDFYKGNATNGPYIMDVQTYLVDKDGYFSSNQWMWVNLGQANDLCNNVHKVDHELIVHEVAHIVGLGNHFEGFGDSNGAWSTSAAAVLRAIYAAPVNTHYLELTVAN